MSRIPALILAAGRSSRAPGFKPLLRYSEATYWTRRPGLVTETGETYRTRRSDRRQSDVMIVESGSPISTM